VYLLSVPLSVPATLALMRRRRRHKIQVGGETRPMNGSTAIASGGLPLLRGSATQSPRVGDERRRHGERGVHRRNSLVQRHYRRVKEEQASKAIEKTLKRDQADSQCVKILLLGTGGAGRASILS